MRRGSNPRSNVDDVDEDEGYLQAALQQLHARLVASQPTFTEEDVVILSFPAPGGSPSHSPSPLPRERESDLDRVGIRAPSNGALARSVSDPSVGGAVDLDEPIRPPQLLAAAAAFDARAVLRNRKAAADALKLLSHAYALVWREPSPLPEAPARVVSPPPNARLVQLLDQCVQSLLVYANESVSLRTLLTTNAPLLRRLGCICQSARRTRGASGTAWRDVDAELAELDGVWRSAALGTACVAALRECYLMEFLLDAALPPAVCSARYDGLVATLGEKKERLVADLLAGRGVAHGLPLRGVAALVGMSTFAEPKLRARALDRMAAEGLLCTVRDAACEALRDLLQPDAMTPTRSGRRARGSPSPPRAKRRRSAESPSRRLGYCLDVLRGLTNPNLAEGHVGPPHRTAVRASAWAARVGEVREIVAALLRASALAGPGGEATRAQAMEGVWQVASYSAVLYGVVVETLDAVLAECCRGARDGCTPAPLWSAGRYYCYCRHAYEATGRLCDRCVGERVAPLLPLVLELLRLDSHAAAHAESVRQWFAWLAECLAPNAFDVPVLTRGRRRPMGCARSSSPPRREAPLLARDVRREEAIALSPFFRFAVRLVAETAWRRGAEAFLARIALLAYNVVLTQARRPNLLFGQASACYDAVAPLLEAAQEFLPGERLGATPPTNAHTPTRRATPSPTATPPPSRGGERKRGRRSDSKGTPQSHSTPAEAEGEAQVFIPSPSQSPLFFEAYSPSVGTRPSTETVDSDSASGASPSSGVVSSLRRRLSLSAWQAALTDWYKGGE